MIVTIMGCIAVLAGLACNAQFSKGIKKDLKTGLSLTYDGFTVEEAVLLDAAGNPLSSNQVKLNEPIKIRVNGIEGFKVINGQVFPGASILVTDRSARQTILDEPDLFTAYDAQGCSPEDAGTITLTVTVGDPIVPDSTYIWKSQIWDKKGQARISIELEFKVLNP